MTDWLAFAKEFTLAFVVMVGVVAFCAAFIATYVATLGRVDLYARFIET